MCPHVIEISNPGSGDALGTVALAEVSDVDKIVADAQRGQKDMAALPAFDRAALLQRVAQIMEDDAEDLARLDAAENGKPIAQTREEVAAAIRIFRGYAGEATRLFGRQIPLDAVPGLAGNLAITMREPLGVVAALIPFNYPIELYAHKAAAAMAAGNAVVVKPPTRCPLSLIRINEYFKRAGAPMYSHQVLVGSRAVVEAIAEHPDIAAVSLTGGTEAGRNVAQRCARRFKKIFLELGGNDPMIVCDDADVERAVDAVVLGRLARGNGQICCAVKRVYVQDGVYEQFVESLVHRAGSLRVGDQLAEDTEVGPLIAESEAVKVREAIEGYVSEGARLMVGGSRDGAFIVPAVLADVAVDGATFATEVFGPVAPVARFGDVEEAVRLANDSPFGLQASVFTNDITRAFRMAKAIDAGGIVINGGSALRAENLPFGGNKDTGGYREGLHDTVYDFTRQKAIIVMGAFE